MKNHLKHLIFTTLIATTPASAIQFADACKPASQIIIGAVGDLMFHDALQRDVYRNRAGFSSLWPDLSALIRKVGVMYGNLESPAAHGVAQGGRATKDPGKRLDGRVYTGFPLFNVHPSIIGALKAEGVDVLSTANNHAMDRGPLGVKRTIDAIKNAGIHHTGSRRISSEHFHAVTHNRGWRIAWVSCTYSTNGIPDPKHQIARCFNGSISKTVASLKSMVDAVIVTPHWGIEYSTSVTARQRRFAHKWIDAGAIAVLGAHPHVPQPWEKYQAKDGREGFIVYSMGNFISTQGGIPKRSSPFIFLGLSKAGGKTWVNGVRYLPLYMLKRPRKVVPAEKSYGFSTRYLTRFYDKDRMLSVREDLVTNKEC